MDGCVYGCLYYLFAVCRAFCFIFFGHLAGRLINVLIG
jgi:hypothetical protein